MFAVDVRLSPLIPLAILFAHAVSLRGVRLAANLYCKNAFRAGHNPKFSGLIPPLFLTPSLAHKALNYNSHEVATHHSARRRGPRWSSRHC